jgi:hypothetical protein
MNMNFRLKSLGAHLHTLMYAMFSKVPCESIGKMDLFRLADLPFLLLAGPAIFRQTYASLRTFQRNLVERTWPSLAEIYPRPMMWFYAYNLFFWSRYCNVLSTVLNQPDRCLPAEIYLRYICQIDTFLDSFNSRTLADHLLPAVEENPKIQAVKTELYRRLNSLSEEDQNGEVIPGLINIYLDHNLLATRRWMAFEKMTPEEIRAFKETTTGELYTTWSQILGYLYRIPEDLAANAARIVCLYGMATQVVDDITDVKQDDMVSSPNILLAIAEGNPGEYEQLISHIRKMERKYIHWPWLKKNVPRSYAQATEWIRSYAGEIRVITRQKPLSDELLALITKMIAVLGYDRLTF